MSEFVICINNASNPASLTVGKVYRRLPDVDAESHHMLRIIDEDTSEPGGYLFPALMFVPMTLPELLRRVDDENLNGEWNTGPAIGNEVW